VITCGRSKLDCAFSVSRACTVECNDNCELRTGKEDEVSAIVGRRIEK